ncbi:MAG: hypothetical protein KUF75_07830 [Candidatus Thiodiazotropha sp. (ex Ctena orbiculata)]|nr:hypothetical protein [Candidatus Thiodiazotropha taylori]
MLKLFSEMKQADEQLYQECVQACMNEKDSHSWFTTKSFGELKRVAEFCNAHSWEIDMQRIAHKFSAFEFGIIESLMKVSGEAALASRERVCRTAAQKTTRFVEHWLKNQETMRQMAELQSKVKRKTPSDARSQWDSLQTVFN